MTLDGHEVGIYTLLVREGVNGPTFLKNNWQYILKTLKLFPLLGICSKENSGIYI